MEHDDEGPILSIFFCEFHATIGPVIVFQYPENYISKDLFEIISVYMIPKPQMSSYKKVITLNGFGHKIIGFPNELKNAKYNRNALIFNLCFVFGSNSRTAQYEPVVKKLSEYLENLESEYEFLSIEDGKKQLPKILKQIYTEMNETRRCIVKVDLKCLLQNEKSGSSRFDKDIADAEFSKSFTGIQERKFSLPYNRKYSESSKTFRKPTTSLDDNYKEEPIHVDDLDIPSVSVIHLKVIGLRPDPIPVRAEHVPLLVCTKEEAIKSLHQWDLTTQQILCYIDGLSHIAKIAAESDVHINLVKSCIQNLFYYGAVKLLPIFQYSNVYTLKPGFGKLYTCKELQEECIRIVSKSNSRFPTLRDIMLMYGSMKHGVTVRDLCLRFNPHSLHIDERRLVQYGLLNGFIHRLHQYPICVQNSSEENCFVRESQPQGREVLVPPNLNNTLYKMCDGSHSIDAICCKLALSYKEVNERLQRDSNIIIIWK